MDYRSPDREGGGELDRLLSFQAPVSPAIQKAVGRQAPCLLPSPLGGQGPGVRGQPPASPSATPASAAPSAPPRQIAPAAFSSPLTSAQPPPASFPPLAKYPLLGNG